MTETTTDHSSANGRQVGLEQEELFPIREVSRITGINPVTLRAWERRYGLIQPTRTESGHRLYSQSDIEEVRSILGWIERGVAVSKVGIYGLSGRALCQRHCSALMSPFGGPGPGQWWAGRLRGVVR